MFVFLITLFFPWGWNLVIDSWDNLSSAQLPLQSIYVSSSLHTSQTSPETCCWGGTGWHVYEHSRSPSRQLKQSRSSPEIGPGPGAKNSSASGGNGAARASEPVEPCCPRSEEHVRDWRKVWGPVSVKALLWRLWHSNWRQITNRWRRRNTRDEVSCQIWPGGDARGEKTFTAEHKVAKLLFKRKRWCVQHPVVVVEEFSEEHLKEFVEIVIKPLCFWRSSTFSLSCDLFRHVTANKKDDSQRRCTCSRMKVKRLR